MGGNGDIAGFATAILNLITGPLGVTLMGIGICAVGFLFLFGRASGEVLARVAVGCAFIYGCAWLVTTITGGGGI